jgi:diamine N-acetyltransferase
MTQRNTDNKKITEVIIREAEVADFTNVIALIKEFSFFQKTPEKVTITLEQMTTEKDFFRCLIAETRNKDVVGFATFFPAFYSWSGKAFYLDDLYVKESSRKQGIGKKLLEAVITLAKEDGCKKVRWQVSGWNADAIYFYEKIGAVLDDTERNCDLML